METVRRADDIIITTLCVFIHMLLKCKGLGKCNILYGTLAVNLKLDNF